jgi:hypothetical protein
VLFRSDDGTETHFPVAWFPAAVKLAIGFQSVSLTPLFKSTPPDSVVANVTTVHGNGVDFALETGVVSASASPGRAVRNFLIEAQLQLSTPQEIKPALLRVHVHGSIARLWPTPSTLRVPVGSEGVLPALYAQFDDGVVADVSHWASLMDGWSITWASANPGRIFFDPTAKGLRASSAPSGPRQDVAVHAVVVDANTATTHSSEPIQAYPVPAWSTPRKLAFVAGPGPARYESVTNILFLGDGFTAAEQPQFEELVSRLVGKIGSSEFAQPFKLLRDSINFWSLFVASEQSGSTLLDEYIPASGSTAGTFRLTEVPRPVEAFQVASNYTVAQLVTLAGLPAPADIVPGESEADAARRFNGYWQQDLERAPIAVLSPSQFAPWLRLAQRAPVEARDTTFAVQLGTRHGAQVGSQHSLTLDPKRMSARGIGELVGALFAEVKDGGVTRQLPVGRVWATTPTRGKDFGLICILSRSTAFGGGTSIEEPPASTYILVRLWRYQGGFEKEEARTQPFRGSFVLQPGSVPPLWGESPHVALNVVHEMAHAFGLADEYGGGIATGSRTATGAANAQWRRDILRTTSDVAGQYDPVLLPSVTTPRLWPSKIRWGQWPRLRAAGELAAKPQVVGSQVRVMLKPGHINEFMLDQRVCLRSRTLFGSDSRKSQSMRIAGIAGDELLLEPATPFTTNDADNYAVVPGVPSPLVILPLRVPGSGLPGTRELPLIAPEILRHIGSSNGPLNAPAVSPSRDCHDGASSVGVQKPTNLPAAYPRTSAMDGAFFRMSDIVGLYEGGMGLDCGVYHPAGDCMMRGAFDHGEPALMSTPATSEFRPFCHVCRYWLVDRIDPSKHRELDELYDQSYPGPRPYE